MKKSVVLLIVLVLSLGVVAGLVQAQTVDPTCTGSLVSRLAVGDQGQVAREFSTLRDAPAGNPIQIVPGGTQFTVIGGPTCADNLIYLQLDYGSGVTGWANESQVVSVWGTNLYWLEPIPVVTPTPTATPTATPTPPPTPTLPPCSGSLANQLNTVGQTGEINRVFSTLRSAPAGPAVEVVYSPATFTVAAPPGGGPSAVCGADGLTYVYIDYGGGMEGWASESQVISIYGRNLYWLVPSS